MPGHLVVSLPRPVRRRFSTLLSIAAHGLVVTAAVAAARPVPKRPTGVAAPPITWHPQAPPPPAVCIRCASPSASGSRGRLNGEEYPLPDRITSDLTLSVSEDVGPVVVGVTISRNEWALGPPTGRAGNATSVFGGTAVDREVVPLPTNPAPRYPAALRTARIGGAVHARFVVDTTGRVIMETVIVDAAEHPLFADAVIEALQHSRFTPAELRGRKVRQLVAQPFVFVIRQ